MQRCEICGEPSVQYTRDFREVEPEADEDTKTLWRKWEPDGLLHARSARHPREMKWTFLDGAVKEGSWDYVGGANGSA